MEGKSEMPAPSLEMSMVLSPRSTAPNPEISSSDLLVSAWDPSDKECDAETKESSCGVA